MKKLFTTIFCLFFLSFSLEADTSCDKMMIESSKYCGGFYTDFTWLYLQSYPTDSDFQVGTFLTLTDDPANLSAKVLQLEPDREGAFRANIGYRVPCSNCDFSLSYFYYNPSDRLDVDGLEFNQFFQNFLGGSYTTLESSGSQRVNQIDFMAGKRFIIDRCFDLHPFVGISYADISRKMDVKYNDLYLSENPSGLIGSLNSDYWGVGPMVGLDFTVPFFSCLHFQGKIGGGVLFGNVKSKLDSTAADADDVSTFYAEDSYTRAVPVVNSQLAFVFRPKCGYKNFGVELKCGVLS